MNFIDVIDKGAILISGGNSSIDGIDCKSFRVSVLQVSARQKICTNHKRANGRTFAQRDLTMTPNAR